MGCLVCLKFQARAGSMAVLLAFIASLASTRHAFCPVPPDDVTMSGLGLLLYQACPLLFTLYRKETQHQ